MVAGLGFTLRLQQIVILPFLFLNIFWFKYAPFYFYFSVVKWFCPFNFLVGLGFEPTTKVGGGDLSAFTIIPGVWVKNC